MSKTLTSLSLCLLLAAPALCETSVWIAKTDSSVLYIGGTVHILRQSDRPFPPEFDRAYEASDLIVLETDFAQLSTPETQQAIAEKATYTDGRTLDSVLSPEALAMLDEYCTNRGIPLAALKQTKPWAIMLTFAIMELQKLGVDQEGIDAFYHARASADGKTLDELETVHEQINVITSMGEGNESAFVIYSLNEMDQIQQQFDSLIIAWRTGNEDVLSDVFTEAARDEFPELYQKVFVHRNMNWLPKIESYLLTKETEFILVGTGHLVGEDGVISQLAELGYVVERLK